ncbi:GLUT4 regulating protein TUG-domain-containing protein [Chytriomyces sp. MP71]|nr:GLUT4 regulating protein TUG-domain-containing protein [Chytriomyces sp. MP71]
MSSQVTVEVEGTFPLKKVVVKTTPAMSLNDVLKSAVEKSGSNASSYSLRHGKTNLDLTLSVRFANLPSGAKLVMSASPASSSSKPAQLARASGVTATDAGVKKANAAAQSTSALATVALQIEDGPRVIRKFNTFETLWDVLKTIELENSELNLTRRLTQPQADAPSSKLPKALQKMSEVARKLASDASQPVYAFPLLILSNKEYSTFDALKSTTLEATGLRGGSNTLIRLLWRIQNDAYWENVKEDVNEAWEPKNVAMVSATQTQQQVLSPAAAMVAATNAAAVSAVPSTTGNELNSQADGLAPMELENPVEVAEPTRADQETEANPAEFDRAIKLYAPPLEGTDGPLNIELPDTFFDLTPKELKQAYAASRSKIASLVEGGALMTQRMREAQDDLRARKYPKTMIRVRFPDRVTLQAAFLSSENVSSLYILISASLAQPSRSYTLYTAPPFNNLAANIESSFWKAGLAPASLVYFKWNDVDVVGSAEYLSTALLELMEPFPLPAGESITELAPEMPGDNMGEEEARQRVAAYAKELREREMDEARREAATRADVVGPAKAAEKKAPKWFKIGKK